MAEFNKVCFQIVCVWLIASSFQFLGMCKQLNIIWEVIRAMWVILGIVWVAGMLQAAQIMLFWSDKAALIRKKKGVKRKDERVEMLENLNRNENDEDSDDLVDQMQLDNISNQEGYKTRRRSSLNSEDIDRLSKFGNFNKPNTPMLNRKNTNPNSIKKIPTINSLNENKESQDTSSQMSSQNNLSGMRNNTNDKIVEEDINEVISNFISKEQDINLKKEGNKASSSGKQTSQGNSTRLNSNLNNEVRMEGNPQSILSSSMKSNQSQKYKIKKKVSINYEKKLNDQNQEEEDVNNRKGTQDLESSNDLDERKITIQSNIYSNRPNPDQSPKKTNDINNLPEQSPVKNNTRRVSFDANTQTSPKKEIDSIQKVSLEKEIESPEQQPSSLKKTDQIDPKEADQIQQEELDKQDYNQDTNLSNNKGKDKINKHASLDQDQSTEVDEQSKQAKAKMNDYKTQEFHSVNQNYNSNYQTVANHNLKEQNSPDKYATAANTNIINEVKSSLKKDTSMDEFHIEEVTIEDQDDLDLMINTEFIHEESKIDELQLKKYGEPQVQEEEEEMDLGHYNFMKPKADQQNVNDDGGSKKSSRRNSRRNSNVSNHSTAKKKHKGKKKK